MSNYEGPKRLTGKKALVTGASRGIGAAIALRLAQEGADVAITYERSAEKAEAVVGEIGRKAVAIQADSADAAAVKASVERAVSELGGLDILVNNAGVARGGDVPDWTLEDIDLTLDVNVRSVIVASQAAAKHMPDRTSRIISIGSCLGETVPFPGLSVYSASKGAVAIFTRGLARDLGPRGITVNVVQPGPVDTDMNPADGEMADGQRARMAIPEYGKPEDIAAAVAWLASPEGHYVTGARITLDGGVNA
ncbi:3-oxoacyl-ACP reductase family protein [Hansschlegelia zhihuaiae]|uniref:3-oxoacyl-ACP reductase FabG n=1 Tax=Hansschlegelia zhihuaiae TaxID=405005 RepID=A0A4Q0M5K0_9HYPH|nr:3-oxoacyl-ACP reductase family protein [Hansschlegelia zhihuaiae]RXF68073.1 3-oxoacyl-ACP reductase FabG [Hansschlegelia zhihuaiae]